MQQDPQKSASSTVVQNHRAGLLRLLLPLIILLFAAAIAYGLMQSKPEAKPRPKPRNATLVDTRLIELGPQTTTVSVMGTVKPQKEVVLKPQVSGEIVAISDKLIPGGHFDKDALLLSIDPADYLLKVRQLVSEVAKAEAELQIETGRQRVAKKEYELLGEYVSNEEQALMLRVPQLASNRAVIEGIKARLEQARLDLQRTTIKAPFNAIVVSREINLGTRVTPGSTLTTLVGSDVYWIEAPVPASQLKWISIGEPHSNTGSPVRVYDSSAWGPDRYRTGRVIGLTARVEEQGRMARLLIEIPDPLSLQNSAEKPPQLLLGSYVKVEIEGTRLPQVAAIERELIHDGNQLWIMDDQDQLDIRQVDIAFLGEEQALVTGGLHAGERLITSNIPSAVQGMSLRLKDAVLKTPNDDSKTRP